MVGTSFIALLCLMVDQFNCILWWCSLPNGSLGTSEETILRKQSLSDILRILTWWRENEESQSSGCRSCARHDASAHGRIHFAREVRPSASIEHSQLSVHCLYKWWVYPSWWNTTYGWCLAWLSGPLHPLWTYQCFCFQSITFLSCRGRNVTTTTAECETEKESSHLASHHAHLCSPMNFSVHNPSFFPFFFLEQRKSNSQVFLTLFACARAILFNDNSAECLMLQLVDWLS